MYACILQQLGDACNTLFAALCLYGNTFCAAVRLLKSDVVFWFCIITTTYNFHHPIKTDYHTGFKLYLFYNDYETSYTTYINQARWHRCLRSDGLRVGGNRSAPEETHLSDLVTSRVRRLQFITQARLRSNLWNPYHLSNIIQTDTTMNCFQLCELYVDTSEYTWRHGFTAACVTSCSTILLTRLSRDLIEKIRGFKYRHFH